MPAVDKFNGATTQSMGGCCVDAVAVTPSDSTDLTYVADALVVTVSGVVNVITQLGTTVAIPMAAGVPFPLRVKRVKAASTTATGIVALYFK